MDKTPSLNSSYSDNKNKETTINLGKIRNNLYLEYKLKIKIITRSKTEKHKNKYLQDNRINKVLKPNQGKLKFYSDKMRSQIISLKMYPDNKIKLNSPHLSPISLYFKHLKQEQLFKITCSLRKKNRQKFSQLNHTILQILNLLIYYYFFNL